MTGCRRPGTHQTFPGCILLWTLCNLVPSVFLFTIYPFFYLILSSLEQGLCICTMLSLCFHPGLLDFSIKNIKITILCHITKKFVMIYFPQILFCLFGSILSDMMACQCANTPKDLHSWKIRDLDLRFRLPQR